MPISTIVINVGPRGPQGEPGSLDAASTIGIVSSNSEYTGTLYADALTGAWLWKMPNNTCTLVGSDGSGISGDTDREDFRTAIALSDTDSPTFSGLNIVSSNSEYTGTLYADALTGAWQWRLPNGTCNLVGSDGTGISTPEDREAFRTAISINDRIIPAGGTTGQVLTKSSGTDYEFDWANLPEQTVANVVDYGAVAGTGQSAGTRTANTAAIQSAIDSGYPVYFPTGTYEIDAALTYDLLGGYMFGDGSQRSIILQTNSAAHGINCVDSPEAATVTKFGRIDRLQIQGVGQASVTVGFHSGLRAVESSAPSNAFLQCRDVYVRGFDIGLELKHCDNSSFLGCEFSLCRSANVQLANQTRTVTFINVSNSQCASGPSWKIDAAGNAAVYGGDCGSSVQHALIAGNCAFRDCNFEIVNGSGAPNGMIETTGNGFVLADNCYMAGGGSTLPAFYILYFAEIRNVQVSGFGAGGGKIRRGLTSYVETSGYRWMGINRDSTTHPLLDVNGSFEMVPPNGIDVRRWDQMNTAVAANRGLLQWGGGNGTNGDRLAAMIYDGSAYTRATVAMLEPKTTTGDPTTGHEGRWVVNTVDNTLKVYADGGWRTVATW